MNVLTMRRDGVASRLTQLLVTPGVLLFASANLANVGNLAFNMAFARLLGPALFADLAMLLSIKLSALCILSALQMAYARSVAASREPVTEHAATASIRASLLTTTLAMLVFMACAEWIATAFAISSPFSLVVVALIVPALVPLSLYRGLAQGRIDLPRMVGSIQAEWMLRLFGGLALYWAGAGFVGIVVAMTLSVYAATLFAARPRQALAAIRSDQSQPPLPGSFYLSALPFVVLQLAQVISLDGDIFLAKAILAEDMAGHAAALALVQRIFFFAFLSFSGLLLPQIARACANDDPQSGRRALINALAGLALLAALPLFILCAAPDLFIRLFLGADFLPAAPYVWAASLTALLFTVSHLLATSDLARGRTSSVYLLAVGAVLQLVLIAALLDREGEALAQLAFIKLVMQSVLLAGISLRLVLARNRTRAA